MSDPIAYTTILFLSLVSLFVLVSLYRYLGRQSLEYAFLGMVILLTLGNEYCLRPWMILRTGIFGWEPSVMRPLVYSDAESLVNASILVLLSLSIFSLFLRLASRPRLGLGGLDAPPRRFRRSTMRLPAGLLAVIGLVVSAGIALRLGRIGGSLQGEFGRLRFGSGYSYLLVNLAGLTVLVAVARLPPAVLKERRTQFILGVSYLGFVAIHFLILGGRAEVIIVTIGLLFLATARLGRPRKPALAAILAMATVLLAVQRVSTREAFTAQNRDVAPLKLAAEALRDPLTLITRYDVSAYDKLVLLEQADGELGYGATYVAALLAPVPGATSARLEGGNRIFTKRFLPDRYNRAVTYEGISMLGEARYNLGWPGPLFVAALCGGAYGFLVRRARRSSTWLLVLAVAAGIFPSLIRADALNTAALGGSLMFVTVLLWAAATRRERRLGADPPSPQLALASS